MKPFERISNPREIRRKLRMNQQEFWSRIGVTQSGGSRYRPVDQRQWRWLAARDACARVAPRALRACIEQVYDARIAELSGAGG